MFGRTALFALLMCSNSHVRLAGAHKSCATDADESLVATPLPDGYWINSFPYSTSAEFPDLIAYGLGSKNVLAPINRFLNPKNDPEGAQGWKVTEIQRFEFPVAMVYADLTGDNFNDIIIIDQFGTGTADVYGMDLKLWPGSEGGGRVQWLRNPGNITDPTNWEAKYIGHSTGMHRLQVGHFTTKEHFQVMGLPILAASSDLKSPAPVIIYSPSYGKNKSEGPESWSEHIAFPSQFRLIHDTKLIPGANGLDMVLVAGLEGIVLLCTLNPYHGSGSVDVARVGDDSVGYIAASEGFHGNVVSVYVKNSHGVKGPESLKQNVWRRIQVDSFGPLDNQTHTGTIHNVHTVKVGASESEAFGIACMGVPNNKPENQGVYVYSPTNLVLGRFNKTKITDKSAAQLAVAAFAETNRADVASISYSVPSYHTSLDPPGVRINRINNTTNICPASLAVVSPINITASQGAS
ncbi:hypothetical protein C8J56DRAFT_1164578 [Mycena floridula]|nr:hypothetical protein C8J56DRAFT_1164578 [Mycena floridula]